MKKYESMHSDNPNQQGRKIIFYPPASPAESKHPSMEILDFSEMSTNSEMQIASS